MENSKITPVDIEYLKNYFVTKDGCAEQHKQLNEQYTTLAMHDVETNTKLSFVIKALMFIGGGVGGLVGKAIWEMFISALGK